MKSKILAVALIAYASPVDADVAKLIRLHQPSLDKRQVEVIAQELKLYPAVMIHIVQRESSFNPSASSKGCIGLAGVNAKIWTKTLKDKKVIRNHKDLWTVKYNLKAGWWIFKHYNKSYKRYRGVR